MPCSEIRFRSKLMVFSRVFICRALAKSRAPTSPIRFPVMSKVCRLWFEPRAFITLLISDLSLQSDKLSLVTDDSSDVISPTMLSITELKYLALTLVIFLLAFKLKRDLFLAKPCITPAISASKLFSLRSRRDKHFTVPIQFSKTLAPCTERLLFDKFSSTLVVASLQAKPNKRFLRASGGILQ